MPISVVLILIGTAMGFYNFRVTGNALRLPYQVHEETYAVAPVFIWQDLRPEPAYRHREIRDFHADYITLYFAQHSLSGFLEKNIGFIWEAVKYYLNVFAIPLLALCPLIQWALRNGWARRALIVYAVLLPGLMLSTVSAVHYPAPITGLNYFLVLSAMRLGRRRYKRAGQIMLWLLPCLAIAALAASVIYATITTDSSSPWHLQRARFLVQLGQDESRHLIVVKYGPLHSVNDEWVYNEAEIDRAKVIWARDMNCRSEL